MGKLSCGLVYFVVAILIGWYLWFRDEGKDTIRDVLEEDLGIKKKLPPDESQLEYQKWWNGLSEEEQTEVITTIHNPGGDEEEQR